MSIYLKIIINYCFFFSSDRKSEGTHSPMKTNDQSHREMEVEEFEFSHQVRYIECSYIFIEYFRFL